MKFFRSKLFISVILLVMVAILAFMVLPQLYSKQAETIDVVKFTADVNLGTRITDDMLTTVTIGRYGTDMGMITQKNAIVGKYAVRNISAKEYLYSEMFSDTFEEVEGAAAMLIEPGQKLFTITTSTLSKSVAAQIKPGSKVDIYTQKELEPIVDEYGNVEENDKIEMELLPQMTGLYVYKVQNSSGEDISMLTRRWEAAIDAGAKDSEVENSSMIPFAVTLIVTNEQAELLAQQEYTGIVHMALYPSGFEDLEATAANNEANANATPDVVADTTVKQVELATTEDYQNLGFDFTFDREISSITLISPPGARLTKDNADVQYSEDGLHCLYRIDNAEPGTWRAEYQKGINENISYEVRAFNDENG